jgi:DNA-binding IclR family transcriptional regulator
MSSTIDRISQIVDLLTQNPRTGMSAQDVAKELGLTRSAVVHQLDLLVEAGIATKDANTKNYGLSLRLYHWGVKVVSPWLPVPGVRQEMAKVAYETRRMVSYTVLEGATAVMLEQTHWFGDHVVIMPFESRNHWTQTASGVAMGAFLPAEELQELIRLESAVPASNRAQSVTELQSRLQEVRRLGFSSRAGVGRYSFACPVIDHETDRPSAALGISIPDPEGKEEVIHAIRDAAFRCSSILSSVHTQNGV